MRTSNHQIAPRSRPNLHVKGFFNSYGFLQGCGRAHSSLDAEGNEKNLRFYSL